MIHKLIKKTILNDNWILKLILLNTVIIIIQEFNIESIYLNVIDITITCIFILEMIIKIHGYGIKNYFHNNWNIFDFILIIISIPSVFQYLYPHLTLDLSAILTLRLFRIFRTARMLKSLRIIHYFPQFEKILEGIKRALKASMTLIVAIIIVIVIFSLLSCSIYKTISPEYFNNPMQAMYSIFKLFSIEGWYEIPDSICKNIDNIYGCIFTKIYFSILLIIGGIIGMSLINSVFVDAMLMKDNEDINNSIKDLNSKVDQLIEELNKQKEN